MTPFGTAAKTEGLLSLGQIIVSNQHLQWFEAVALVQEICSQALSAALPPETVPEPSSIFVAADGLTLVPGPVSGHPVRRLGLVLGALLQAQGTPAELRLFVSRATSEPPLYPSIDEFSEALAYFERPDRAQIIRAVYEKVTSPSAAPLAPAPAPQPQEPKPRPKLTRAHVLIASGVAAVLAAVAIAAAPASSSWSKEGLSRVADSIKTSVAGYLQEGVTVGRGMLAEAGLVDPPAPVVLPVEAPAAPVSAPVVRRAAPIRQPTATAPPGISAAEIRRVEIGAPAPARGLGVAGAEQPPDGPRPRNPTVYSTSDAGVIPPTLVYPTLRGSVPSDVNPGAVSLLEVMVDEQGFVTSLKLLTPPGRFEDRMLLSAVKAWRFRPAMFEGRPVKFRHLVRLNH